jgi:hypothetical protein
MNRLYEQRISTAQVTAYNVLYKHYHYLEQRVQSCSSSTSQRTTVRVSNVVSTKLAKGSSKSSYNLQRFTVAVTLSTVSQLAITMLTVTLLESSSSSEATDSYDDGNTATSATMTTEQQQQQFHL